MTILQIPVICFPGIRWLIWRFFQFQSPAFPAFVDSYDDSLNFSHLLSRYSLTYMAILRIPVICFPGIRWLIWQFFEFQSSVYPASVDLYGDSSNSSHQFTRHLLTYMAILRIPVTCSSSFYSSLDNKTQLSTVLSLSQQSSCVSLSPKYTGNRNFMCFRNLPSGCSCS